MSYDPGETIHVPTSPDFKTLAAEFAPDTRFDDYELLEMLGRGGMGEVWRAKDIPGNRDVAIKFVPREIVNAEEEMDRVREMFAQVHGLQHENICPLYVMKSTPGFGTYLVMRYIPGMTLAKFAREVRRRRGGAFPVEMLAKILKPVAAALDYAHRKNVIHRDVKPGNIMIVGDAETGKIEDVQLIDFGLAATFRASMSRVSQQKASPSGTRPYMAPEQWTSAFQGAATDQYALGVSAYEILSGDFPFYTADVEMLRLSVLHDRPTEISGQPAAVNAALARVLAKERKARFASCGDFINAMSGERDNRQMPEVPREAVSENDSREERNEWPPEVHGGVLKAVVVAMLLTFGIAMMGTGLSTLSVLLITAIPVYLFFAKKKPWLEEPRDAQRSGKVMKPGSPIVWEKVLTSAEDHRKTLRENVEEVEKWRATLGCLATFVMIAVAVIIFLMIATLRAGGRAHEVSSLFFLLAGVPIILLLAGKFAGKWSRTGLAIFLAFIIFLIGPMIFFFFMGVSAQVEPLHIELPRAWEEPITVPTSSDQGAWIRVWNSKGEEITETPAQ